MKSLLVPVAATAFVFACSCGKVSDDPPVNSGGSGGSPAQGGGAHSDLTTELLPAKVASKIDLLLMIDNSASMADKQAVLAQAVPDLVSRLTNPICVEATSRLACPGGTQVAPGADCPLGCQRKFAPVDDLHIGVITSSLGGHGADSCDPGGISAFNARQADMAHLIDRKLGGGTVPTYDGKKFLNWDPTGTKSMPPGENNVNTLNANFIEMVKGAGEDGCGFEMSLEAWYRFLVDPEPPKAWVLQPGGDTAVAVPDGVDDELLRQRKDFMRPDSLLAVVMLTDENDCSVNDWGQSYLALQATQGSGMFHLPRGTKACETDPNSAACVSCWQVDPNNPPAECKTGWDDVDLDDALNLRCWEQKRRFGIDFLYPIKRYVDGLRETKVADRTGQLRYNPIFCSEVGANGTCAHVIRDQSLVLLAGVVGVPWQDIANDPKDLKAGYRPAEQFNWTKSRFETEQLAPPLGIDGDDTLWSVILGKVTPTMDIDPAVKPKDPLMIESVEARTGVNPATGAKLATPSQPPGTAGSNPINGFEWSIERHDDLQYACIFDLPTPIDCKATDSFGCECRASNEKPLCYNTGTGSYGPIQFRAKAYPGRRQLAVLKGVEDQGLVASICPSNLTDLGAADYGYRPAIAAIADRIESTFGGSCWGHALNPEADGSVPCVVLEASRSDADGTCSGCEGIRSVPTQDEIGALSEEPTYVGNGLDCACRIDQASGADLVACITQDDPQVNGWCYVDPSRNPEANAKVVADCPVGQKRLIRFLGQAVPQSGTVTFVQCRGGTVN